MEMKRVMAVLEGTEEIGDIRMIDGFAGIIDHKILFRDIGHIVALIIFGQEMIEGLLARRAAFLWNGIIPFFGVAKFRIDIKNHAAKRVFFMPYNLAQMIFRVCFHHRIAASVKER